MKNLTNRILTLIGIALISAVMVFSFASCKTEDDPDNNDPPEILSELQNTEWTHTSGDKISFDKNSVTVTPSGGSPKKFTLEDSSSIDQSGIKQTILFFNKDDQTKDTITYRNGSVTMVDFSIIPALNRTNGWNKGSGNNNGNGINLNDFTYKIGPDTFYMITGYKGTGGDVIIPSEIKGIKVTIICFDAFKGKNLTNIIIPDNVTWIETNAFTSNSSLISITIGANVTLLENNAGKCFDNNFDTVYKNTYNKSKGTYTRTVGSDVWTKVS